jgi:hypothetical protein
MEANQMEKKLVFKRKSQDADGGGLEDGKLMQDPGRGVLQSLKRAGLWKSTKEVRLRRRWNRMRKTTCWKLT